MSEPRLLDVKVCELCVAGDGGECHVPGCAFWMSDAPTSPLQAAEAKQVGWIGPLGVPGEFHGAGHDEGREHATADNCRPVYVLVDVGA